jgi:hypothetical protein
MALSVIAKRLMRVAFGSKKYGDEVTTALDAVTAAGPTTVSPSVIDNIVSFSGIVGQCQDSGVAIGAIAAAQADATAALANSQVAASANLAGAAPTSAVCVAAFGSVVSQNGLCHVILDSSDATKTWIVCSDGVKYWAVAVVATV